MSQNTAEYEAGPAWSFGIRHAQEHMRRTPGPHYNLPDPWLSVQANAKTLHKNLPRPKDLNCSPGPKYVIGSMFDYRKEREKKTRRRCKTALDDVFIAHFTPESKIKKRHNHGFRSAGASPISSKVFSPFDLKHSSRSTPQVFNFNTGIDFTSTSNCWSPASGTHCPYLRSPSPAFTPDSHLKKQKSTRRIKKIKKENCWLNAQIRTPVSAIKPNW